MTDFTDNQTITNTPAFSENALDSFFDNASSQIVETDELQATSEQADTNEIMAEDDKDDIETDADIEMVELKLEVVGYPIGAACASVLVANAPDTSAVESSVVLSNFVIIHSESKQVKLAENFCNNLSYSKNHTTK